MEWAFDGIGTELISILLTIAVAGFVGYKIHVKKVGSQNQTAKNGAHQKQILEIDGDQAIENSHITNSIHQKQKAGDNAVQEQIGSVKHGK